MKNARYRFFKYFIIIKLLVFWGAGLLYAQETPFIPKNLRVKAVIPYDEGRNSFDSEPNNVVFPSLNSLELTKNDESGILGGEIFRNDISRRNMAKASSYFSTDFVNMGRKGVFVEERGYETSSVYVRTAARYLSASGDAITSSFMGGLAAGFYTGLDRFMDTGSLDVASSARSAALMVGSSYVGLSAGSFTANNIINPVFGSSLGGGFVNAFGSVAGGTAAGFLYATGAYAFGAVDRHTARLMVAKTAFGSAASAGITAIIGTSTATTGIFAVGPYLMPFVAALGAGYLVEKFFELVDKEEEKERIDNLIREIR